MLWILAFYAFSICLAEGMDFFFPPAEFRFGRAADWCCMSITELYSELQKSCSVAVSKLSLPEFFKRPCADLDLVLQCLEAAVQHRR